MSSSLPDAMGGVCLPHTGQRTSSAEISTGEPSTSQGSTANGPPSMAGGITQRQPSSGTFDPLQFFSTVPYLYYHRYFTERFNVVPRSSHREAVMRYPNSHSFRGA